MSIILTVLMSMAELQAFAAYDTSTRVLVNGLYYYLDNDNYLAQITSGPFGEYTGDITIPSSFFTYVNTNYSVTSIGSSAFFGCRGLTSITIPNSVMSIGENAFYHCSGLTSIAIPNSVTSIGQFAFYGCSGLVSITIPNSVTSIGNTAFSGCSGLTSVTIPKSVTSIGEQAFRNCSGLTSVTLNSNAIVSKDYTSSNNIKTIFGNQVTEYMVQGGKSVDSPHAPNQIS